MNSSVELTPSEINLMFSRQLVEEVEEDSSDDPIPATASSAVEIERRREIAQLRSELDRIAGAIRGHDAQIRGLFRRGVEEARAIGALLNEVAGLIPHGYLEQWVEQNCQFSMRTAQLYRQIDTHWDWLLAQFEANAQPVAGWTLHRVSTLLGQRNPKPQADPPSRDTRDEQTDGGDGSSDPAEGREDRTDARGTTDSDEGRSSEATRSDPAVVQPVTPAHEAMSDPVEACYVDVITARDNSDLTEAIGDVAPIEQPRRDDAENGASAALREPDTVFENQIRTLVELLRHKGGALEKQIAALHDRFCVEERAYQESKAAEAGVSFSRRFAVEVVRCVADHLSNHDTSWW